MNVSGIAKLATSIAETGNRQEVQTAVLKRALDTEKTTATQLLESVKAVPSTQNLPSHLGNRINTTA